MRKLLLCGAVAALSFIGLSASAGITKDLINSNVACDGGSSDGFTLGNERFIAEIAVADCGDRVAFYHVVPAAVDTDDLNEVLDYLASIGIANVNPVFSNGGESCGVSGVDRDPDSAGCFANDGLPGSTGPGRFEAGRFRW